MALHESVVAYYTQLGAQAQAHIRHEVLCFPHLAKKLYHAELIAHLSHTDHTYDVCLAGAPALDGCCGDPACVCAPPDPCDNSSCEQLPCERCAPTEEPQWCMHCSGGEITPDGICSLGGFHDEPSKNEMDEIMRLRDLIWSR